MRRIQSVKNDLHCAGRPDRAPDVPRMMKAVLLTGHGGLDTLEYRKDVPIPRLQRGDVLVRVHACSVNNTDINTRVGWYGARVSTEVSTEVALRGVDRSKTEPASWNRHPMVFPRIQGAAVAGVIAGLGPGVFEAEIGRRVVVDPVVRDTSCDRRAGGVEYLGSERDGGFAEYVSVPAVNVLAAPESLSFTELACLPCAYQTAEEMQLRTCVARGDRVIVTGASGGVGMANIQLAKLRGAQVFAIAAASKSEGLLRYGADAVIPRDSDEFSAELLRVVGERGADVVLDVVGGDTVRHLWMTLDRAGRFATAGAIAGPISIVDMRDVIYKDLKLFGVTVPETEALQNITRYASEGSLKPVVGHIFPLEQLKEAQRLFADKRHIGKVVIEVTR